MAAGEAPKAEGPKLSASVGNLVWFALGMIVMGVIGTVGFYAWLQGQIKAQVQSADAVRYLVADKDFQSAVADLADKKGFVTKAELSSTLKEIKLVAKGRDDLTHQYGCGEDDGADGTSLIVMYGLRDGTGCKVGNLNYYKELELQFPE